MTDGTTVRSGLRVFYAYSHRDEELRVELDKHLSLLQRQRLITVWHDRRITPGSEWKGEIDGNLATADVILLLVTSDFISSDYCFDVEMKVALERHQSGDATVIPIILRSVDWQSAPFATAQALPTDGKAVTTWENADEAFTDIARGIRRAILERLSIEPPARQGVEASQSSIGPPFPRNRSTKAFPGLEPAQLSEPDAKLVERRIVSFAEALKVGARLLDNSDGALHFELDLHHIYLRGTNRPITAVALWGDSSAHEHTLRELSMKALKSFGVVICFSDAARDAALNLQRHYCVLSSSELNRIIASKDPVKPLRELIVRQLGIRRVSPYNVMQPAEGSMFFGRRGELDRLVMDRDVSYAIVGPSLIGKSSLLAQYRWLSVLNRWPDASRIFYINMAECPPHQQSVLRYIAFRIEASNRADRITESTVLSFFRYQSKKAGGPLELLLDEVDHICSMTSFELIGNAAKEGLVRLILSGRGDLMRFSMNPTSRLSLRLQMLRPGALEKEPAQNVLVKPMGDLGLRYEDQKCVDHICDMTGGLPFLLQYYGQALVVMAHTTHASTITMSSIESFENQFDTIHFMMRPIAEIQEPSARALAVAILKSGIWDFTAKDISAIAVREGWQLQAHQVFDLCNVLCIHGVLVYKEGVFSIANRALRDLASKSGYLDLVD